MRILQRLLTFTASTALVCAFVLAPQQVDAANYTSVNVRLETGDGTFFNQTVYVSDEGCTVTDLSSGTHALTGDNALCALDAASKSGNFSYTLSYFSGFGLLLNSIGTYTSGADYWMYYVNYQEASVGMADYNLAEGDELLLSFGGYNLPLRMNVSSTAVVTGEPITATIDWYSYDWMTSAGSYVPAAGATVTFGDTTVVTDAMGVASFTPTAAGELKVQATATGFTRALSKTVNVYAQQAELPKTTKVERKKQTDAGLAYLESRINTQNLVDGNPALTQWSAMAFASSKQTNAKIADAVRAYTPDETATSTDIARYILALEAIGENSRNFKGVHWVQRLETTMSGAQFGGTSYCNDDIFAGLALIAADQMTATSKAQKALAYSMNCINDDGGVAYSLTGSSDVDTTASWVMLASKMIDTPAFAAIIGDKYEKAQQYIRKAQNPDGGWGYQKGETSNSSSTAWVMMGLSSTGHEAKAMTKNKNNGFSYMKSVQKENGAFAYDKKGTESNETLNTAYGVVAVRMSALPVNKKIEDKTEGGVQRAEAAKKKALADKKVIENKKLSTLNEKDLKNRLNTYKRAATKAKTAGDLAAQKKAEKDYAAVQKELASRK